MSENEDFLQKRDALLRIIKRLPAQAMYYGTALGTIALIGGANLPPELALVSSTLGAGVVSNVLERVAKGEEISDEELVEKLQEAVMKSDIDKLLTKQEFKKELREFLNQHDEILTETLRIEFLDGIENLATRQQAETLLKNQERMFALLEAPSRTSTKSKSASAYHKSKELVKFIENSIEKIIASKNKSQLGLFNISMVLGNLIVSIEQSITESQKRDLEELGWQCSNRGALNVWTVSDDRKLSNLIAVDLIKIHYEVLQLDMDII